VGGEDWEGEEDPDLADEPVLQMDMQVGVVWLYAQCSTLHLCSWSLELQCA